MKAPEEHERALVLALGSDAHPADAFEALLAHPDVRAWNFPAPWAFERTGLDLLEVRPSLGSIRREDLRGVLGALVQLATPEALASLARREWRAVPEPVRQFHLQRPMASVMASILKVAPRSADLEPPPSFAQTQVYLARFEMEYRLDRSPDEPREPAAPPEEGSLVFYPFDPSNRVVREDLDLGEGPGPVLEAFAYAPGRARHRRVLEEVATSRGWRVADTTDMDPRP